jgi:tRNA A37 methylthiotransferase MiaB
LVEAVNKGGMLVGKTESSKVVRIHTTHSANSEDAQYMQNAAEKIGKFMLVKITEAEDFGLKGEIINN